MSGVRRLRLVRRVVLTKQTFETLIRRVDDRTREVQAQTSEVQAQTRDLPLVHGDTVSRLDTLAHDSAALLEAVRELAMGVADTARRDDLDRAIHALETRLVRALDERDRLAYDRLDLVRERLETRIDAPAKGPRSPAAAGDPQSREIDGDDVEPALLAYLAPFLSDPHAIDVGAHRGRYADALLGQGMEVAAVEPNPELAGPLEARLAHHPAAHVRALALDAQPGRTRLRLADANGGDSDPTLFSTLLERERAGPIEFRDGPEVETTTVDLLRDELGWPPGIGLLKVDVEGAEERVLSGLGATRAELLMVEYWGPDHVLALPGDDGAAAGPPGGSRRSLTLIHESDGEVQFAVNARDVPPDSWGNVLFFDSPDPFLAAVRWCRSHLPERFA